MAAMSTADNPRLGTPTRHHVSELHTYHKNPRMGDVDSIKTSMLVNGVYKPIVVNAGTHTGRPLEVLAGNHSLKALRELAEENPDDPRWQQVDVWQVDVDDDTAARIVLADNRTADMGSYDNEQLLELLDTLDGDLDGTGYLDDDVDMLRDLLEGAPSLDELEDEYGEPEDEDTYITIRFKVPPMLAEQWYDWMKAYDSPEEAFEALLDKGTDYGASA